MEELPQVAVRAAKESQDGMRPIVNARSRHVVKYRLL